MNAILTYEEYATILQQLGNIELCVLQISCFSGGSLAALQGRGFTGSVISASNTTEPLITTAPVTSSCKRSFAPREQCRRRFRWKGVGPRSSGLRKSERNVTIHVSERPHGRPHPNGDAARLGHPTDGNTVIHDADGVCHSTWRFGNSDCNASARHPGHPGVQCDLTDH